MDSTLKMVLLVLTMAGVTYVIRAIPLTFFRKKIKNEFIRSVLYYIPYSVLSAMTFPYIFYSTNNFITALVGTVVALVAALSKRSLLVVAILSCLAVLVTGFII
jgi:branched-subunit amino acid transport protein